MKLFKKAKKGFTLVELVVVIAVIAILSAVSVGAYFGITTSANNSAAQQEAKAIHTNLVLLANDPNNDLGIAYTNEGVKVAEGKVTESGTDGAKVYTVDAGFSKKLVSAIEEATGLDFNGCEHREAHANAGSISFKAVSKTLIKEFVYTSAKNVVVTVDITTGTPSI